MEENSGLLGNFHLQRSHGFSTSVMPNETFFGFQLEIFVHVRYLSESQYCKRKLQLLYHLVWWCSWKFLSEENPNSLLLRNFVT